MKIAYNEDHSTTIEINEDESIESALIRFHILMFRFMQALSENTGMSLDKARELCTMDDRQFTLIMASELKIGLENLESEGK